MTSQLFTLEELAGYLRLSEEDITTLVDKKVISAYKIGGELLRFRKEQIDATRAEIYSRVKKMDHTPISDTRKNVKERMNGLSSGIESNTFLEKVADFFYFNDFYIISGALIVILLVIIIRG